MRPAEKYSKGRSGGGYKEQIHIGQQIAAALPQRMTQKQVAAKLGISRTMVGRIEAMALFKLRVRLAAAMGIEAGIRL
jgi:transcriptional regulator with XRE-family HTH domain